MTQLWDMCMVLRKILALPWKAVRSLPGGNTLLQAPTSPQRHWSLKPGFQDKLTLFFLWELIQEGSLCPVSQEGVIVGSLLLVSGIPEAVQSDAERMLVPWGAMSCVKSKQSCRVVHRCL